METRGPISTELLCLSWLPATLINKPASKVIKNLNSFQIREQLFFQGLVTPMSAVWTCQKSNLL